jgi:hypothetical protein
VLHIAEMERLGGEEYLINLEELMVESSNAGVHKHYEFY